MILNLNLTSNIINIKYLNFGSINYFLILLIFFNMSILYIYLKALNAKEGNKARILSPTINSTLTKQQRIDFVF